jgi:hypothetical protein
VAIGVIERLEKVGIDHDQRKRRTGAARPPPFEVEDLFEVTAISNPG